MDSYTEPSIYMQARERGQQGEESALLAADLGGFDLQHSMWSVEPIWIDSSSQEKLLSDKNISLWLHHTIIVK